MSVHPACADKCRITWHPIAFTFNLAQSRADETLQRYQERFEPLDIPTTGVYVTAETTHVMTGKRNTPKGLRALVNGKHLVTTAFSDAVEKAATLVPGQQGSPLEQDFDANWPKEVDYLPPPASEPHPRPAELFKPDAQRQSIFQGFTFIFATQLLWDNLHPMVLDGGAKALKYDVEMGETRVEDFVQFVLDAAEKKGLRSLGDTTQAKGVVFVRFRGEGEYLDWSVRFIESVDAQLEQRSIEQNEFLDAILTKDVSKLRQPLQEEEFQDLVGTRAPPSTAVPPTSAAPRTTTAARTTRQSPQPSQSAAQEPVTASQMPRTAASQLRARRVITTSRFKGFDDFDESQFSRRKSQVQEINDEDDEEEEDQPAPSQSQAYSIRRTSNTNNDSQSLFISDSQDGPSQPNNTQFSSTSINPRKRRAPPSPSPEPAPEDEEDAYDAMFPAAAAMKKRRLEDEAAGRSKTYLSQTAKDLAASQAPATKAKPKKPKKELDVRSAAKIRAEALDAQREGGEKEEEKMTAEEIAAFRPDFQMATLSLRERPEVTTTTDDDRIDPRWVGRKNFKKFVKSRPGTRNEDETSSFVVNNRARKVIVTLEEAKRKTYGLGEEDYFLEPESKRRGGGASQSQSQSQARGKERRAQQLDATTNVHSADEQEADDDVEPEEIAGQPREGPVAAALRRLGGDEEETQTTQTQASTRKRAAPVAKSAPPSKMRSGRAPVASRRQQDEDDDDSEEEEVVFKLRKPVRG